MRRVATAACLIPVVIYVIFGGPQWLFLSVIALLAVLCFHEFCGIAAASGVQLPEPLGHLAGIALILLPVADWRFTVAMAMLALIWSLRLDDLKFALPQASYLVLGVLYTFGAWRCATVLHERSAWWIFFAVSINWVGDTAAFYCGRAFGKHKLAPVVSPGKTWEGAAGAIVFSVIYGVLLLGRQFPEVSPLNFAVLSLVANVAGQFGDLAESALKRGAGVKDSGHMLPGHGGWLDRLDSSLFSMPVVAFYLSVVPQS